MEEKTVRLLVSSIGANWKEYPREKVRLMDNAREWRTHLVAGRDKQGRVWVHRDPRVKGKEEAVEQAAAPSTSSPGPRRRAR